MNYQEWVESVPESIKGDTVWKMEAYRLSFFACDIGWYDVTRLLKDRRTLEISDQLYRLTQVIKLLLTMIPGQRDYKLNEPQTQYHPNPDELLSHVPLPES